MTVDPQVARAIERESDLLAHILVRLASQRRTVGFRIPELDADPDVDDPTNMWMLSDGRIRTRTSDGLIHEYLSVEDQRPAVPTFAADPASSTGWKLWSLTSGAVRLRLANGTIETIFAGTSSTSGGTPTSGGPTSGTPRPPNPAPRRYVKHYKATWSEIYCQVHGTGEESGTLHYGRWSSTHGERRVMIGFNDSLIRSETAGGSIKAVRFRMLNTDAWAFAGISIHIGAHNNSSSPGSFAAVRRDAYVAHWPEHGWGGSGSGHWRAVSNWFGNSFRDNKIKGVTIDQPTGVTNYGEADARTAEFEITYVK
jgi:hypothetical protein